MEITNAMIEVTYDLAKNVYTNVIKENEALSILTNEHGMNRNSAADYIHNLKYMIDGIEYARTNNEYATEYFLKNIYTDFGIDKFRNALNALDKHIIYYESLGQGKLPGQREIYLKYKSLLNSDIIIYPDEIIDKDYFEGSKKKILVNSYERDPEARNKCIEYYGAKCTTCDFDFKKKYGLIGVGFIHVHHLRELSEIGKEYQVNPIKDLRPVCPNCHAMLHKKKPAYTIDELKSYIKH